MEVAFLFFGGVAAGFINTLASSGSAISLPILLFLGLPPHQANATNRVATLAAACSSIVVYIRKKTIDWKHAPYIIIPIFLGSASGALLADWLPNQALRSIITFAVFMALVMALVSRRRMLNSVENKAVKFGPIPIILLFLVGIWAGLIVLDGYTYMLIVLVLGAGYDLVRANSLKAVGGITSTVTALLIFSKDGEVDWKAGIIMGIGSIVGAWLGALIAANERFKVWVYRVLIATISLELILLVIKG